MNILDGTDLPQIDESKNYLELLVGETAKFKTPEDLAKGKWYSDQMIEIQNKRLDAMNEENRRLREENVAKAKLEDLIKQATTSNAQPQVNDEQKPAIDLKQIEDLFTTKLSAAKQADREATNFTTFKTKLTERFGSNEAALDQQIESLGLDKQDLIALAKKSPTAATRMLGLDRQETDNFLSPPHSQQRNDNFAPTTKKKTWSYYQEVKKKNPEWLYDRKLANEMADSAAQLGDAFYDGDFYQ